MSSDPSLHRDRPHVEINEMVKALDNGATKGSKKDPSNFSVRKSSYNVDGSDHTVNGWKFQDWDYKKRFELPTYARGLFTFRDKVSGNNLIVVRGYDKFFNIDEIYRTKWSWIHDNTKGPYELTLKENGCIIFISGLPDGTLLVCSKNSTGTRGDTDLSGNHAKVGEKWIEKHLANVGKTRKELAETLYNANATAVAELCDDSFEEHILPYEADNAGLYIHGVNLNLPKFATYPMNEVAKFADNWGFKKIDFFLENNVDNLKRFLESAAETGSWEGKDVEGFVIRCKARDGPNDTEWHDWFFKYKFEEPYLLYRQWRECTKQLINGKAPRFKKHVKITSEYLRYAAAYFTQNPGASADYQKNHGIIKLRNSFLGTTGLKGEDIIKQAAAEEVEDLSKGIILAPIATLGCGKTTVAYALKHLFDWGHEQNDNVTARSGKGAAFARLCAMQLLIKPVVFADRNNHQKRERKQLIDDISKSRHDAKFVALHYVHYDPKNRKLLDQIRSATRQRIFARGDNHQTIHADSEDKHKIIGIMEGFINRFQPVDMQEDPDKEFDLVINLDPLVDSRKNLETVVTQLRAAYPKLIKEEPTSEMYDEAIKAAFEEYKPDIKHKVGARGTNEKRQNAPKQKKDDGSKEVEYFFISLPTSAILDVLELTFSNATDEQRAFFDELKKANRIQQRFHVTLLHRAEFQKHQDLWERYLGLYRAKSPEKQSIGSARVRLEAIVWDGRVMAIPALIVDPEWPSANKIPHITIGTNLGVKPKESNDMLAKRGSVTQEVKIEGIVELEGAVEAVKPGRG